MLLRRFYVTENAHGTFLLFTKSLSADRLAWMQLQSQRTKEVRYHHTKLSVCCLADICLITSDRVLKYDIPPVTPSPAGTPRSSTPIISTATVESVVNSIASTSSEAAAPEVYS